MRKTKWAVTFAMVFALSGVAATQVAPVWADSSKSSENGDEVKKTESGEGSDDKDDKDDDKKISKNDETSPSDFGPCVTGMKTAAKKTEKSEKEDDDDVEDKDSGKDKDEVKKSDNDDEHHGKGKTQVTGTTDTPCTNRGLSNERRVAWKEIKL